MRIPFSKVALAGNESKYLDEVLASGWLTTSSKTMTFENTFARHVGARYALAVNSCTSALHLAAEAIGIQKGDKVLVPSLTFTATAEVLRYLDADPVFLDVDYETRNVTSAIIREALRKHPDSKAVIIVHYGGQAAQMISNDGDSILKTAEENKLKIIEDAAHSFPTRLNGRYVGTFGDITCFSFYANKTITTGEGGMLTTDSDEIYNRVKLMRLHGIDRDIWKRYTTDKASWEYDVVAPGFKYNMSDLNAAIGLAQMEKAEEFRLQRQRCAKRYLENLKDLSSIEIPTYKCSPEDHSWHLFPVIIKPSAKVKRNDFMREMADAGIGTSVHFKPLHRMTYYSNTYKLNPDDFPNTEKIWNGTVSLPLYPNLSDDEIDYVCETIFRILA